VPAAFACDSVTKIDERKFQATDLQSNGGVPWFKDIPILSFFVSRQNNQRTKTELLVLITPHVIHDQRDARAFTEDLREQLPSAVGMLDRSTTLPATGLPVPTSDLRRRLRLQ